MYRTLFGILAVFAAALVTAGLTFRTTVESPADFRFANGSEPKTLDPHLATGEPEGRLLWELFEGLMRYEPKTMKPAPGVAESYVVTEDGLEYTFQLRENARWSDGSPVTAHDFAYSFRRLLTPELGSEYSYLLSPVRLAVELSTFDALADTVRTKLLPGLERLRKENAGAVPAAAFQRFLADAGAYEPLEHAKDAAMTALLARRQGSLTPAELDDFARKLGGLEKDFRAGAVHARAHFGVDKGAFARDERTFVVELRAPTPYFLELMCFYPAMPVKRSVVEDPATRNAWFLPENIVGNGPFRLKSWAVNDRVRLERSDTYWNRDSVRLNTVDALAIESANTALNLYLTGAIDWLPKLYPKDLVDVVKTHPDFYSDPGLVVYHYRLNTTRKPLNDRRVRQALSLAIDRESIVRNVLGLGQLPAYTFVPPGLPDYESPQVPGRMDVPRARSLLAEAGYPGGKGFPKIGILYNTNEDHKKLAEVIADQLRRNLGVEVFPYNQEWQSYLETTRQLDYDMARAGWVGDYNDPNTFLDLWVTNGPNNQTGFGSARYDRLIRLAADVSPLVSAPESWLSEFEEPARLRPLIEKARGASGAERLRAVALIRMAVFREAEAILVGSEFPILPIYFYVNSGFVRPGVRGFYRKLETQSGKPGINLKDVHPLSAVWMDSRKAAQ